MRGGQKISDEQFLSILRENGGLLSMTARAIQERFGVKYTRQAVKDRCVKFHDELQDIYEENLDVAEDGLRTLMQTKNENVRMRAIELFLKTIGKKRGYVERQEVDVNESGSYTIKIEKPA